MQPIRSFVQRNAFVVFIGLTFLLSWWPAFFNAGLLPHGPLLAALLVVGLSEGKAGLKAWWGRTMHRGVAWRWYAVAAAIPLVLTFTAAALNVLLGAQLPAQIDWTIPFQVLPILLLLGGQWEEPGWMGFGMPYLYKRFGASVAGIVTATLIMAVIRAAWHLPLMLSGSIYWSDLGFLIGFQIVFTWLFNRTGGVVLTVMLCHLLNNIVSGAFVARWFTGLDGVNNAWLFAVLWVLLGVGLLVATGLKLGHKPAVQAEALRVNQPLAAK
jgi:uncharacterized protein